MNTDLYLRKDLFFLICTFRNMHGICFYIAFVLYHVIAYLVDSELHLTHHLY